MPKLRYIARTGGGEGSLDIGGLCDESSICEEARFY